MKKSFPTNFFFSFFFLSLWYGKQHLHHLSFVGHRGYELSHHLAAPHPQGTHAPPSVQDQGSRGCPISQTLPTTYQEGWPKEGWGTTHPQDWRLGLRPKHQLPTSQAVVREGGKPPKLFSLFFIFFLAVWKLRRIFDSSKKGMTPHQGRTLKRWLGSSKGTCPKLFGWFFLPIKIFFDKGSSYEFDLFWFWKNLKFWILF